MRWPKPCGYDPQAATGVPVRRSHRRRRLSERHKDGRTGRGRVEQDGQSEDRAADVWGVAGMEHARAASARQCAAIDACRLAWAAEAESGGALRDLVRANDAIVDGPGGGIRRGPIADAAAALRRTIDAIERAAVEFSQASKLSVVAADEWERAAHAFDRAGLVDKPRAARCRADEARKMARGMEGQAARSRKSADTFGKAADGWVARTADWEDGDRACCGMGGWAERRGGALDMADRRRKRAEDMERSTQESARLAEIESDHMAAKTEDLAAKADAILEEIEAPEAAAALREGREAAVRAVRDL